MKVLGVKEVEWKNKNVFVLRELFQVKFAAKYPTISQQNIGIYSIVARKKKIRKFLEKRKKRSWQKKLRYAVRKKIAGCRVRVKGRFIKSGQSADAAVRQAGRGTAAHAHVPKVLL